MGCEEKMEITSIGSCLQISLKHSGKRVFHAVTSPDPYKGWQHWTVISYSIIASG